MAAQPDTASIADLRKNYTKESLDLADTDPDPITQFKKWFAQALDSNLPEPNAMALATAASNMQPSVRIVLLKGVDERGFIFYTNYGSRKGIDLAQNKRAGICFNWLELERQIRIEGSCEKLPGAESDQYFASRPFESRIGALASHQSSVVRDRQQLQTQFDQLKSEYEGKEVPRPENWGGYLVKPLRLEFWQGRPGRLHDRIEYNLNDNGVWERRRLSP
ncbi:MAG: pyridoxamine 5'-phosphate oxidase [Balneolales bacterium]|nr:pyridoxamine 5'-phosphate oxidase [Balneolales bacterium]